MSLIPLIAALALLLLKKTLTFFYSISAWYCSPKTTGTISHFNLQFQENRFFWSFASHEGFYLFTQSIFIDVGGKQATGKVNITT